MIKHDLYDCIIVGGGLSGSLLFYGLKATHPNIKVLLLEKDSKLGGNHTWCFHEDDINNYNNNWIRDLISKSWDSYEVIFPRYHRILKSSYHSIQSNKLHDLLINKYSDSISLNSDISFLGENEVKFISGDTLKAHCVVDARGWKKTESIPSGYQKFVGLDIKLKRPHGLSGVRLKDARVEQIDGYRFVYVLPWSEDEVLVEDTYYSNSSELN
ncbi:MAG: lycopene cyclase family protein, partial [Bacteriovoracaceae bacterium]